MKKQKIYNELIIQNFPASQCKYCKYNRVNEFTDFCTNKLPNENNCTFLEEELKFIEANNGNT